MKSFITILILISIAPNLLSKIVDLPHGASITIDKNLDKSEWGSSVSEMMFGGGVVLFHQDENYINIGIKGEFGGFPSLGVLVDGEIHIMHASTSLITAIYKQSKGRWILDEPFRSDRGDRIRNIEDGNKMRKLYLKEFGWCSNRVPFTIPKEQKRPIYFEYKIKKSLFSKNITKISVAYLQRGGEISIARLPKDLSDGSINKGMVMGGDKEVLNFNPDSWLELRW